MTYESILMRTVVMIFHCESYGLEANILKVTINLQKRNK